MDAVVFVAVLAAAACHAGWNAVIKGGGDPLLTTAIVTICAGIVGLLLVPFVGLPDPAAWPWVAASVAVHALYFGALIEAYRYGDLGQIYPIARGSAPLMTAAATTAIIGERIGAAGWGGVVLLAAGVLLISLRGDLVRFNRQGVGFALLTAVTICLYTVVDGIGARVSGQPSAYTAALFVGCSIVMLVYVVVRRGFRAFASLGPQLPAGLAGGAMQLVSYGVAIWAMTVAPIAIVAALRETSVLFGALIAVIVLKEHVSPARAFAALLIVAGLAMLRLA
jgi:drug/metabolite transporter (DMT)-like permease